MPLSASLDQPINALHSAARRRLRFVRVLLMMLVATPCAHAQDASPKNTATPADEFALTITTDPSEASSIATASIRIHATKAALWDILTSCAEALQIVPGLMQCEVQETAPDQSWQRIRQVMEYSWFTPRMSYVVLASYNKPDGIAFEKIAGDQIRLRGSWHLQRDGDYTVAQYVLEFAPGFWAPRWFVRAALKRDLPKMLRSLRAHAEAARTG
jgi:hypothetical protein